MEPSRWVMHVDMDAFFAAIEQRDDPSLRGKPVVIGAQPGGRGVVATCSYEARAFGIRSAMPINEAYRRCPDAVYLRPDITRYRAASKAIMQALDSLSPVVEPVSIDEAYVDVTGLEALLGPPDRIARTTQQRLFEAVQLPASVGIGPNRLIAKLASDHRKPKGIVVVAPHQVQGFLDPLSVRKLRGIGRKTAAGLERLGFHRVADLRRCPHALLVAHFGLKGADLLYDQSRGIGSDAVGEHGPRKSLSRELTFPEDIADWTLLHDALLDLAADVGYHARAEGWAGHVITLKIRFTGFETHTRRHTLERPTNHDRVLFHTTWALAQDPTFQDRAVRLIGVGLSDGQPAVQQMDLFAPETTAERDHRLYALLDEVQNRWGRQGLRFGMPRAHAQSAPDGRCVVPEKNENSGLGTGSA